MPTLKLRKSPIWRRSHGASRFPLSFSMRRPWVYASLLGVAGLFVLVKFAALPLVAQSDTVPVNSIASQAEPGLATSNLLKDLNSQGVAAEPLDYVTHRYLTGRGTLLGFAGDNIQIFEYPAAETAHNEALAIWGRAPRLATESFFHLYLQGNLIGLYFGHNAEVLKATEETMGVSLVPPSSTYSKTTPVVGTHLPK